MAKSQKKVTSKKPEEKMNYCTMQTSKVCSEKEGILAESEFHTSVAAEVYRNGRYNICKKCMQEYCYKDGEIRLDRFKKILRIFDMPFLEKEFKTSLGSKNETIGVYIRCINLNKSDFTWLDSDGLNLSMDALKDEQIFKVTKDIVRRWGKNYDDEDYELMEDIYKEWCDNHDSNTLAEQKTFKYITMKEFDILKAREEEGSGKDIKDLEDSLRKFMSNAKVVPKEIKTTVSTEAEEAYGNIVAMIERTTPAEYYKDKKIYFDYDGLLDYLNRFVFRPLKNILAKTKEYDREFSVENISGFMDKEVSEKYKYGNELEEKSVNKDIEVEEIKDKSLDSKTIIIDENIEF